MKYPFSPEILDAMPEELAELYRELEIDILKRICNQLNMAGELNEVSVQGICALRSHGIALPEIEKAIQKTSNISQEKLDGLLDDVVARNQKYYGGLADLAKITVPAHIVGSAEIEAIRKQTKGTFRNLSRSMGFLVDNGQTMLPPAKAYQWAVDKAITKIDSGAYSYNQAITEAVTELADSGLVTSYIEDKKTGMHHKSVVYQSGHKDHIDVAIRRATMTGINQICSRYSEESMDFLKTDLVEVSAHRGARNVDGPNGWENHERWQGKVYRWRKSQ